MKAEAGKIALSVVIPAYNEAERIAPTLRKICAALTARGIPFEVLVVSDGSSDQTVSVVSELAQKSSEIRCIELVQNVGKGFAVRWGALNARGDLILYTDADGAAEITELDRLIAAAENGADIAFGSRAITSKDTKVSAVIHRKVLGRIFNFLVNFLLLPRVKDTQCGFKLFRRDAAKKVFSHQTLPGFSFDVEILFIGHKLGLILKEVPISWHNVAGSKVRIIADSFRMLRDILIIRARHRSLLS